MSAAPAEGTIIPNDALHMPSGDIAKGIRVLEEAFTFPEPELVRLRQRLYILDLLPKGSIGAEIGVFRGHFAAEICRRVRPSRLYLVDPWTCMGDHFDWGTGRYVAHGKLTTQAARDEAQLRTADFPKVETVTIEGYFPACAGLIRDRLDWAYLDASHRYEDTLRELFAVARLVRPDGLILGDDWQPDPDKMHHGVFQAVQAFVEETDWQIISCGPARQWALRRPASAGA